MSQTVGDTALARAREALDRGEWEQAYSILVDADRAGELDVEGLETLGVAGQLSGHLAEALSAWERAHGLRAATDDPLSAAMAALRAAIILLDIGSSVRAKGWLSRAHRLLEDVDETAVHGWLQAARSLFSFLDGDVEAMGEAARAAREIGERASDASLRATGLHWEARALILRGEVEKGLELLDEVAAEAASGQLDPLTTANVYCSTVCASQAVAEYRRAEEWTRAMEGWCERHQLSFYPGLCRVHRAEIMRLRGDWARAEGEALRACGELQPFGPAEVGWALHELGMVRLRLGDLAGAEEAFMRANERGRPPQPGLSLLQLERGELDVATMSIRRVLDEPTEMRSWEAPLDTPLGRTVLLPAQVEIALAAGDVERARWAAEELRTLADRFGTEPLLASASGCEGAVQLAQGDVTSARRSLQAAVAQWSQVGAPYETARARMKLGEAHRAAGDEPLALIEFRTARATFERLGAVRDAERAQQAAGDPSAPGGRRERKTFFFTDIVGSTNLLEAMGDEAWGHVLRWHNEQISSLVAARGGEVLRLTGDGFFISFDSPDDAATTAVAILRALEEHRRSSGFAPRVRIGFHATEATREGDDYRGKGVHVAARIGALADGDEILTDAPTMEAMSESFPSSARRTETLKGLADPVDVVAIDWR